MPRRKKADEQRLYVVELPRFPAMGAASRITDNALPELARAGEALVNAWKILFREADRCAAERAAAEQEKEAA